MHAGPQFPAPVRTEAAAQRHLDASPGDKKLTKEEQLLRERQRCAFSGITQYSLDAPTGRLVFSERSELFCFDDRHAETPEMRNSKSK